MSRRAETGWVIELAESSTSAPMYLTYYVRTSPVGTPRHGWTTDHMRALRLARRGDAEMLAVSLPGGLELYRVVEHMWMLV